MESIPVYGRKTRRGHSKSRTGCTNCKRRKVKCDETRPACFNSKRHDIPCSLAQTESSDTTAPRAKARRISLHSIDAKPLSWPLSPILSLHVYVHHDKTSSHASSPLCEGATPLAHLAPVPPNELLRRGFELMHHYCTVTADTLSIRRDMTYVWQVAVPRQGYKYSFVFNGVLAMNAAHKAYILGSEGFRHELHNLTEDNWMALFGFASVLVLYSFSLPARSMPRKLNDSTTSFLELGSLVWGIKSSLSSVVPHIYNSEVSPLIYGIWPAESHGRLSGYPSLNRTFLLHHLWDATKRLQAFHEAKVLLLNRDQYQNAVETLEHSARLLAFAGIYAESSAIIV